MWCSRRIGGVNGPSPTLGNCLVAIKVLVVSPVFAKIFMLAPVKLLCGCD